MGDLEDELDEFDEDDVDLGFPNIGDEQYEEGGSGDNVQASDKLGQEHTREEAADDKHKAAEPENKGRALPADFYDVMQEILAEFERL